MTDPRPNPVTPAERLHRIVEDGLCIGCGLCQSLAGPERLHMSKVENGALRPVVTGALDHETVDRIYDVCPGTRLEGLPERLVEAATRQDLVWGAYRRMTLAYAADPEVRFKGSTGGVLTALGRYLVTSGRVEFVLHVKASARHPTFGERQISRDVGEVLAGAGSRYGPAAPLVEIGETLDMGAPFAFVGKPCDIAALRNYARLDPRVDALVKYWLTPVCGGYMSPEGMADFLAREGLEPEQITGFRYRGYGCPGPTRIELADGRSRELTYSDMWGDDESKWSLPFRCKICPDGIGEAADVAAADTWPGGSPDPAKEQQDPGTNAIVIRTAAGLELVESAARAGATVLEGDVDPRYMDSVQPHQTKKKLSARARWDGLAAEGRMVPRSARLRLDALHAENGDLNNRRELEGTRERVRAGKTSEATPKPV